MSNYLTKTEVAALLRVTTRTVENYLKQKRIPDPIKVGGRPLWDKPSLLSAIQGATA